MLQQCDGPVRDSDVQIQMGLITITTKGPTYEVSAEVAGFHLSISSSLHDIGSAHTLGVL